MEARELISIDEKIELILSRDLHLKKDFEKSKKEIHKLLIEFTKQNKPKPIFIVNIPSYFTSEDMKDIDHKLREKLTDYHVLVVRKDVENIGVECFYEKDFTHIKFEELKEIVKNKTK